MPCLVVAVTFITLEYFDRIEKAISSDTFSHCLFNAFKQVFGSSCKKLIKIIVSQCDWVNNMRADQVIHLCIFYFCLQRNLFQVTTGCSITDDSVCLGSNWRFVHYRFSPL